MISGADCLKDIMKRYKDACRRFLKRPAEFLIRRLPEQVRESLAAGVRKRMEGQYADTEQQMQLRVREFLVKEGMLVFWGMAVLAVMLASLAIYRFVEPPSLIFERNSFGEGEKEVSVILQNGEQEREYALTLGEQELSQEEERTLKDRFFDELEEEMAGENVSLRQVNRELQGAPVVEYRIGEEVEMEKDFLINFTMEGYAVTVNRAEVLSYEEFLEKYDAEDEYTHVPDKVYDVEITLANKGAEESVGVSLNEFRIQGLATGGSLDRNLLMVANPALGEEVSIALRKNTEMVFHLPFGLYEENFRKKNWENLDNYEMYFVATLYPTKKVIRLA